MNKPPAFMFYAKDWLTDLKVRSMSAAQKGYYIDLLATMWLEGGKLPSDVEVLCNLTGASKKDILAILPCFDEDGKDYTQKRMQIEIDKQRVRRESQSNNAKKRWAAGAPPPVKVDIPGAAKKFQDSLNRFNKANPKKYSVAMYKEFYDYWGIPEHIDNPKKLVYQKEKSWNLKRRLQSWYARTDKGKMAPDVEISIDTTPIDMNK